MYLLSCSLYIKGGWRFELCGIFKKEIPLYRKDSGCAFATSVVFVVGMSYQAGRWVWRARYMAILWKRRSKPWIWALRWPLVLEPSIDQSNSLHEQPWGSPFKATFGGAFAAAAAAQLTVTTATTKEAITVHIHGKGGQGRDWPRVICGWDQHFHLAALSLSLSKSRILAAMTCMHVYSSIYIVDITHHFSPVQLWKRDLKREKLLNLHSNIY